MIRFISHKQRVRLISVMMVVLLAFGIAEATSLTVSATKVDTAVPQEEPDWPKYKELTADALYAVNITTGKVLVDYNSEKSVYPASTTKLLTALTVVSDATFDPNALVTCGSTDLVMPDASFVTASLVDGEKWRTEDLLEVLLTASANDAANVLATHYGPGIEAFAQKMNTKAKEIGMTATNFVNPSGIHNDAHKTTARDMTVLLSKVLEQPVLSRMIQMPGFIAPATNKHAPRGWEYYAQTNYLVRFGRELLPPYYAENLGGKTGTTDEAGYCLVNAARAWNGDIIVGAVYGAGLVGGKRLQISVVMRTLMVEAAQKAGLAEGPPAPTEPKPTAEAPDTSVPVTVSPSKQPTENTVEQLSLWERVKRPSLWNTEIRIIFVMGLVQLILLMTVINQAIKRRRLKRKVRERMR